MAGSATEKKPIVFFSHSTRDADTLKRLKEMFCNKTGGSIEVFLSSDGQSIPLGRNWVYTVQEAMKGAKVFFVFLTPNSLESDWIFFEAGYAYSNGIRVIPIGFFDVDLGTVPPPLGLLQGFNITSPEGLNNLIAVANEEFAHNHRLSFNSSEFDELLTTYHTGSGGAAIIAGGVIDEIEFNISQREGFNVAPSNAPETIAKLLAKHQIEYVIHKETILCHGARFSASSSSLRIVLDPISAARLCPILEDVFRTILTKGLSAAPFYFKVDTSLVNIAEAHKATSRLHGTQVALSTVEKDWTYTFKTIKFSIDRRHIVCTCCGERIAFDEMVELLNLLYERQVIGVIRHE